MVFATFMVFVAFMAFVAFVAFMAFMAFMAFIAGAVLSLSFFFSFWLLGGGSVSSGIQTHRLPQVLTTGIYAKYHGILK